MVDFGSDILDTEVPEVEPLDVDISEEPQHELTMALTSGSVKSSSPVVFDFSLQSRVEVILNAIINDLVYGEHPKSRVEQILLYILGEVNELPKPHSRVEELLIDLALELESTDISPKSRVEQILLVLLNQPYEFPITHSRVEELLVQLQKHVSEVTGPLPLTINTDGTALIDYRIYGNTVQTDTPTPDNPIMPIGCGERTENVMPSAPAETKTSNGITVTCDGNGVYTLSGTALSYTNIVFRFKDFTIPISVGQGGQGTMSLFNTVPSGQVGQVGMEFINGNTSIDAWSINSENRKSNSYITMGGKVCNAIQFYVYAGNNCDCIIKPCFTNDSIYPATYIPYGYKLPLTLGSTTTDIYLGEVQSTRRIKKLVLTGEESWNTSRRLIGSMYAYNSQFPGIKGAQAVYCSHLPYTSMSSYQYGTITTTDTDVNLWMFTETQSPAAFKAYLQQQYANGTPVTIWYVLAEPETAVVNEPLMKIGDYTDTVSMEQAGVSIPTIAGTTIIDYDGTPKPSQMYVKYNES